MKLCNCGNPSGKILNSYPAKCGDCWKPIEKNTLKGEIIGIGNIVVSNNRIKRESILSE